MGLDPFLDQSILPPDLQGMVAFGIHYSKEAPAMPLKTEVGAEERLQALQDATNVCPDTEFSRCCLEERSH